jgi:hypothetical protein
MKDTGDESLERYKRSLGVEGERTRMEKGEREGCGIHFFPPWVCWGG